MDGEIQRFEILGTVKKFTSKAAARKEASQRLKEINERLAGITVAGLCDRFKRVRKRKLRAPAALDRHVQIIFETGARQVGRPAR